MSVSEADGIKIHPSNHPSYPAASDFYLHLRKSNIPVAHHTPIMADIMIRKRKRMRSKEVKALADELEALFGVPLFSEADGVDLAESSDYQLIFVKSDILGLIYDGKPFLTIRGILKYRPQKRSVTVDMGAVPFVTNGADVMGPGILDADPDIAEGDMVWIKDAKNGAPLAIGVALRSAQDLASKQPGKAIKTIHFVGDKLWKTGE